MTIRTLQLALFFLIFFAGASTQSVAEIYRWVDSDGNVNYGERPPSGKTDAKVVPITPPPSESKGVGAASGADGTRELIEKLDKMEEERKQKEREEEDVRNESERRGKACADATAELKKLNNLPGYSSYWKTKNGYEMLTPEVRSRQQGILEDVIKKNCE